MTDQISTYYKDNGDYCVVYKATAGTYAIDYYNHTGMKISYELFPNNSINYVEDAAENWALGIKTLDFIQD
jgi:hypothetical protein